MSWHSEESTSAWLVAYFFLLPGKPSLQWGSVAVRGGGGRNLPQEHLAPAGGRALAHPQTDRQTDRQTHIQTHTRRHRQTAARQWRHGRVQVWSSTCFISGALKRSRGQRQRRVLGRNTGKEGSEETIRDPVVWGVRGWYTGKESIGIARVDRQGYINQWGNGEGRTF